MAQGEFSRGLYIALKMKAFAKLWPYSLEKLSCMSYLLRIYNQIEVLNLWFD